jgi:hypothetical protein
MLCCVNRADTSPIDEDTVDFPEGWAGYRLDRRGRGTPRPVAVDPAAPEHLQALYAAAGDRLERGIERISVPAQAASIRAALAGEADPFGAAGAVNLSNTIVHGRSRTESDGIARDAWIATHGIAFAAAATIELLAYSVHGAQYDESTIRVNFEQNHIRRFGHALGHLHRILPMRSLIAALPDAEHAEVRAAVARHCTTDMHRHLAAMLMPDVEEWVQDACRLQSEERWISEHFWAIATRPEHLELAGVRHLNVYQCGEATIAGLVDALGPDAFPLLASTLEQDDKVSAEDRDRIYDAIGRLPSDAAIAYLLDNAIVPQAMTAARAAAGRFPTRTLRAIAGLAPRASSAERARLAGFARDLAGHLPKLDGEDRASVEALLHTRPTADAMPDVFAVPPWTGFAKPTAKSAVTGLVPPVIDELRWAPGEQEEWATVPDQYENWLRWGTWQNVLARGSSAAGYYFAAALAFAPDEYALPVFAEWDGTFTEASVTEVKGIIARYGDAAAAKVLALVRQRPAFRPALLPFVNLDTARIAADSLARSRVHRGFARAWLDRHAADAVALLVPDAVGKAAKERKSAGEALRYLAAENRSLVEEGAAAYGEAAAQAVAVLLDADPLDPQLARLPKPPAWADQALLPQLLLPGREAALPAEAVAVLITALAIDDPDRPYPGVELLAAACDPVSLSAFSWGLFELWLSAGSPTKDGWAMDQLRRFADEDAVRRLTALIRAWPGQNQSRKAVRGLEILGAIGTEAALRAVQDLSRTSKFKALKQTATEQIEIIAERLDLDADRLADRLVPDFGLAGASALVLDYGPRSFTIEFDERLRPYVIDENGKRRASAPKPAATDDPGLAPAAYERFAALRREIKATSEQQVKRLEAAMVTGRTWTFAECRRYLVDHPLVWQLSSRLVWQAESGAAFRFAEDRTLADVDDEPFALADDANVRIAHPAALGEEATAAWAGVLADYEILQPFEQLARPVFTLTDEDRATGRVARFEGAKAGAGAIIGLLKRGWKYGNPGEGRYGGFHFAFPAGGYVRLEPNADLHPADYPEGERVLERVECVLGETEPDPLALSEALHVVAKLTHTA